MWETLKAYLKSRITSFASAKKRECGENRIPLKKKVKELNLSFATAPSPDSWLIYGYELKLYLVPAEFTLLQLRQDFWELGEKAGKLLTYHLRQKTFAHRIPAAVINMVNYMHNLKTLIKSSLMDKLDTTTTTHVLD